MAQGYYKLKGGPAYRFTLHAANHEVILTSENYDSKAGARGGIESVRKNGPDTKSYEKKTSTASQPYFVLKAANGQVIGTSEMYSSEGARDHGIASVQSNSPSATVKEE